MADWTTRELALSWLNTYYGTMQDQRIVASARLIDFNNFYPGCTDPTAVSSFNQLSILLTAVVMFMRKVIEKDAGYDPPYLLPYILEHYTADPGASAEITWQQIIRAWGKAGDAGRMWTITSIDQMRQNIWNKDTQIKWNENPFED